MDAPEKPPMVMTADNSAADTSVERMAPGSIIYIDPKKEAAVLRKFDKFVLPVSVVFLVLSTLDRNNLGNAVVFGFDTDLGLVGGQFGNINTLSSVCGIGLILLPSSAETAWFLSTEEKEIMRLKKQRDIIHRGDEKFDRKWIKIALTDPFVYFLGIAFFTSSVAINGFGVFLPTILAGLGYASLSVNYMTIPVYVLGAISLVIQVYLSDKTKKRAAFIIGSCIPVAVGYLICVGTPNPHAGYAGMFILVLAVTWIATNLSPDDKRAIGMPVAYSIANISALVSSQLYPDQQGPRYIQGNAISAGLTVVAAFLYGGCWLLLKRRNAKKKRLIADGATTNGLEGDMSLGSTYIL
ncbi:hypothetical protein ZTR_00610 [Talaromyces verruculosus]|nr:hypothetical protein ZTR_00610 [Talaromyces verruculosus]